MYTVKNGYRFSRPQPVRESLARDIPAGDGKNDTVYKYTRDA
jgi:hypothetical protein